MSFLWHVIILNLKRVVEIPRISSLKLVSVLSRIAEVDIITLAVRNRTDQTSILAVRGVGSARNSYGSPFPVTGVKVQGGMLSPLQDTTAFTSRVRGSWRELRAETQYARSISSVPYH